MKNNRIKPIDDVRVVLEYNGKEKDAYQGSGFHTVEEVVEAAYDSTDKGHLDIEDYVFLVKNLSTGTEARYRVNAGGNVKVLPEEGVAPVPE